jgi:magnesium chelatase family protein
MTRQPPGWRVPVWKEHFTMTSSPPWGPDTGQASTAAVIGVVGHPVDVRVIIANGLASFTIAGLPGSFHRETRDRVRAAVLNSGHTWPGRAITVDLLPASLPKRGSSLDLAIAVAVLTATGAVPAGAADGCVFYAELGLDGSLRPARGVVPALLAAADAGCTRAVVAAQNAAGAVMVPGLDVMACQSLRTVVAWLRGEQFPAESAVPATSAPAPLAAPAVSLAALGVPPLLRLALEASAAGGHHLCLSGPRGSRIPALAAGLAALLPALSQEEVMEVAAIYSAAGLLGSGHPLITRPPFRAPHHTATRTAILGGGPGIIRPGEAVLAHRGVLFLDDAPEFGRDVLTSLREPLRAGEVTVARGDSTVRFPARFPLVAGTARCPCGVQCECRCTPMQARRYRARVAGELGSYFAICLDADAPGPAANGTEEPNADADVTSAARVAAARDRARHRFHGTPWQVNNDIPGAEQRRSYLPAAEAAAPLRRAVDLGEISTRTAHQVIRVAWTLADLAGSTRPGPAECGQALAFHLGTAR